MGKKLWCDKKKIITVRDRDMQLAVDILRRCIFSRCANRNSFPREYKSFPRSFVLEQCMTIN